VIPDLLIGVSNSGGDPERGQLVLGRRWHTVDSVIIVRRLGSLTFR
jgi:hypothetical protein